jgi:hypothetical protein
MTPLEAAAAIVDALTCLTGWDQLIEELDGSVGQEPLQIDLDPLARAVCILDLRARAVLRQLEREVVG